MENIKVKVLVMFRVEKYLADNKLCLPEYLGVVPSASYAEENIEGFFGFFTIGREKGVCANRVRIHQVVSLLARGELSTCEIEEICEAITASVIEDFLQVLDAWGGQLEGSSISSESFH
jgi:hypothetical protein